ncbi:hypothetical protein BDW22DRAFT_870217 [Trametopsis cervina]|nr:hypothetical protein BDW22DRAFT_870217 [Trametopsis cervina]
MRRVPTLVLSERWYWEICLIASRSIPLHVFDSPPAHSTFDFCNHDHVWLVKMDSETAETTLGHSLTEDITQPVTLPSPESQPAHVDSSHGDHSTTNRVRESNHIPEPYCFNMTEHSSASAVRARLNFFLVHGDSRTSYLEPTHGDVHEIALAAYLSLGLAYTVGSALGYTPPSAETCLEAFLVPNKAGLTAGARAWSKHAHRSGNDRADIIDHASLRAKSVKWWDVPSGPVKLINMRAEELFWKVWRGATWRNLHWLPHRVLVYELNMHHLHDAAIGTSMIASDSESPSWIFRGFLEPQMEDGHKLRWRHYC